MSDWTLGPCPVCGDPLRSSITVGPRKANGRRDAVMAIHPEDCQRHAVCLGNPGGGGGGEPVPHEGAA